MKCIESDVMRYKARLFLSSPLFSPLSSPLLPFLLPSLPPSLLSSLLLPLLLLGGNPPPLRTHPWPCHGDAPHQRGGGGWHGISWRSPRSSHSLQHSAEVLQGCHLCESQPNIPIQIGQDLRYVFSIAVCKIQVLHWVFAISVERWKKLLLSRRKVLFTAASWLQICSPEKGYIWEPFIYFTYSCQET